MALLTAAGLRVAEHGHDVVVASFTLEGSRAAVLGAPRVLFEVAAGVKAPAAGSISSDHPLERAGHIHAFPPAWSALEWLGWRIRLAGVSARAAEVQARELLGGFGLGEHAHTLLPKCPPLVRGALPLVGALGVKRPEGVVLLDDPFDGLDDADANALAEAFARHASRFVAFLPWLSLRSPLARGLERVVVIDEGRVVAVGSPEELLSNERTYVLRVAAGSWPERLHDLGIRVLGQKPFGEGTELTVAFEGERGPRDVFALAADAGEAVLELFPTASKLTA